MRYAGVDLHKQSISVCVVELQDRQRVVVARKRLRCDDEEAILVYRVLSLRQDAIGPEDLSIDPS